MGDLQLFCSHRISTGHQLFYVTNTSRTSHFFCPLITMPVPIVPSFLLVVFVLLTFHFDLNTTTHVLRLGHHLISLPLCLFIHAMCMYLGIVREQSLAPKSLSITHEQSPLANFYLKRNLFGNFELNDSIIEKAVFRRLTSIALKPLNRLHF